MLFTQSSSAHTIGHSSYLCPERHCKYILVRTESYTILPSTDSGKERSSGKICLWMERRKALSLSLPRSTISPTSTLRQRLLGCHGTKARRTTKTADNGIFFTLHEIILFFLYICYYLFFNLSSSFYFYYCLLLFVIIFRIGGILFSFIILLLLLLI